jgi:hypothetical protein
MQAFCIWKYLFLNIPNILYVFFCFHTLLIGIIEQCNSKKIALSYVSKQKFKC